MLVSVINWYFDGTVQEQDKVRLVHELEQSATDWAQLIYTKLRRHLEKHPQEKTACKIDGGKVESGAEGLSYLRVMMYRRDEETTQCHIYVGTYEAIISQSEKLKAELMQGANQPGRTTTVIERRRYD
jgi:hypothetical protein